jgi:hypothetical protein
MGEGFTTPLAFLSSPASLPQGKKRAEPTLGSAFLMMPRFRVFLHRRVSDHERAADKADFPDRSDAECIECAAQLGGHELTYRSLIDHCSELPGCRPLDLVSDELVDAGDSANNTIKVR